VCNSCGHSPVGKLYITVQSSLFAANESTQKVETAQSFFTIKPNPAKDLLYIQLNGKALVSLTNQQGKILLTKTIEGTGAINVAALPAGLYYLKNNATGAVQKVVVTK